MVVVTVVVVLVLVVVVEPAATVVVVVVVVAGSWVVTLPKRKRNEIAAAESRRRSIPRQIKKNVLFISGVVIYHQQFLFITGISFHWSGGWHLAPCGGHQNIGHRLLHYSLPLLILPLYTSRFSLVRDFLTHFNFSFYFAFLSLR